MAMKLRIAAVAVAILGLGAALLAALIHDRGSGHVDYAGLEARTIKALSAAEIGDLRQGRGMGMALSAELNGYPGPRHVLDLAEHLGLSPVERQRTEQLFTGMLDEATRRGEAVIAAEAALDALFRSGAATEEQLKEAVRVAAAARGELRLVHLQSHIAMRAMLTPEQIAAYQRHRGYGGHHLGHGG